MKNDNKLIAEFMGKIDHTYQAVVEFIENLN